MNKILNLLLLFLLICEAYGQIYDLNKPCTQAVDVDGVHQEAGEGFRKHPNQRECQKYIACVGNVGHLQQCPGNQHFDRCKQNICASPSDITCTEKCKPCPETGISNIPSDTKNQCHEFNMCVNGDVYLTSCANGLLFNMKTLTCEPFEKVECKIDTCLITKGFEFAYAPDLKDCRKFFVCQDGEEKLSLECATGQKYSMHETDQIGDTEFHGRCVSSTGFVECFNGQNFPPPTKVKPDCEKDPNQPECQSTLPSTPIPPATPPPNGFDCDGDDAEKPFCVRGCNSKPNNLLCSLECEPGKANENHFWCKNECDKITNKANPLCNCKDSNENTLCDCTNNEDSLLCIRGCDTDTTNDRCSLDCTKAPGNADTWCINECDDDPEKTDCKTPPTLNCDGEDADKPFCVRGCNLKPNNLLCSLECEPGKTNENHFWCKNECDKITNKANPLCNCKDSNENSLCDCTNNEGSLLCIRGCDTDTTNDRCSLDCTKAPGNADTWCINECDDDPEKTDCKTPPTLNCDGEDADKPFCVRGCNLKPNNLLCSLECEPGKANENHFWCKNECDKITNKANPLCNCKDSNENSLCDCTNNEDSLLCIRGCDTDTTNNRCSLDCTKAPGNIDPWCDKECDTKPGPPSPPECDLP